MVARLDLKYRHFRIIAGEGTCGARAIVYQGSVTVFEAAGTSCDDPVGRAKRLVDQWISAEIDKRPAPHIGTTEDYVRALQSLTIGAHHAAMLRAHASAPGRTLTATELAVAAGYENYPTANAHYGKLGHQIADVLHLQPQPSGVRDEPLWTSVLAEPSKEAVHSSHWRWTMHPQLAEALRSLNMA